MAPGTKPTAARTPARAYLVPASILIAGLFLASAWVYTAERASDREGGTDDATAVPESTPDSVDPGVELPAVWGDLGARMASAGVFDRDRLVELYQSRGALGDRDLALIDGSGNGRLRITRENAALLLNLLWALGLGNRNEILTNGPMADPRYGGADRFASTGGWTLARSTPSNSSGQAGGGQAPGNAMDHYGAHRLVELSASEQELVARVAKNVYRPCCDNPTHFPDCNHGMAMLGLLELMASGGASEDEMYRAALAVNSYWFPEAYRTIARYLSSEGRNLVDADPREILGAEYSSASGFRSIASLVPPEAPQTQGGGGSCGV